MSMTSLAKAPEMPTVPTKMMRAKFREEEEDKMTIPEEEKEEAAEMRKVVEHSQVYFFSH